MPTGDPLMYVGENLTFANNFQDVVRSVVLNLPVKAQLPRSAVFSSACFLHCTSTLAWGAFWGVKVDGVALKDYLGACDWRLAHSRLQKARASHLTVSKRFSADLDCRGLVFWRSRPELRSSGCSYRACAAHDPAHRVVQRFRLRGVSQVRCGLRAAPAAGVQGGSFGADRRAFGVVAVVVGVWEADRRGGAGAHRRPQKESNSGARAWSRDRGSRRRVAGGLLLRGAEQRRRSGGGGSSDQGSAATKAPARSAQRWWWWRTHRRPRGTLRWRREWSGAGGCAWGKCAAIGSAQEIIWTPRRAKRTWNFFLTTICMLNRKLPIQPSTKEAGKSGGAGGGMHAAAAGYRRLQHATENDDAGSGVLVVGAAKVRRAARPPSFASLAGCRVLFRRSCVRASSAAAATNRIAASVIPLACRRQAAGRQSKKYGEGGAGSESRAQPCRQRAHLQLDRVLHSFNRSGREHRRSPS